MNLKWLCTKQGLSTVTEINPGRVQEQHGYPHTCFLWLGGLILHPRSFLRSREVLTWTLSFGFAEPFFLCLGHVWSCHRTGRASHRHQSFKVPISQFTIQDLGWWLDGRLWVMPVLHCSVDSLSWKYYLSSSSRSDEDQEPQLLSAGYSSKKRPAPALDNSQHALVSFQVWPSQKYNGRFRPSAASPTSVHYILPYKVKPSFAWL